MTLTELKGLRDQVRGLTGADREVDAEIGCLVRWNPYEPHHYPERSIGAIFAPTGHGWMGFTMPGEDTVRGSWPSPTYTGSTDAAVAFSEKALPGVWYILAKGRVRHTEPLYACELLFGNKRLSIAEADTLPLAIIDATLTALLETME